MRSTPNYALTYPEPADHTRTWEYWQSLAQQLDTLLHDTLMPTITAAIPRTAAGYIQTTIAAGGWQSYSLTVTLPAGRFTAPPNVVANAADSAFYAVTTPMSETAFQVATAWNAAQALGAAVSPQVNWIALQVPTGTPPTAGARGIPVPAGEVTAICHTAGCANRDIPLIIPVMDLDAINIACGVCGEPVTDVTQVA